MKHLGQRSWWMFLILAGCVLPVDWGGQTVSAQARIDNLRAAGLQARVTVRRDERGIPHIETANDHDLYFAQGYVTASDRLWQMDVLRRTGRGARARIAAGTFSARHAGCGQRQNHWRARRGSANHSRLPRCRSAVRAASASAPRRTSCRRFRCA